MCEKHEHSLHCDDLQRRSLLKRAGVAITLGLVGVDLFTGSAHADALTRAKRDKMTPDQIIEAMKKGNQRF
jgi:carbonic anhydrase